MSASIVSGLIMPKSDPERVAELFPTCNPQYEPVGYKILVQFARVPEKSKGGILFSQQTRDEDQVIVVNAKILKIGVAAFKIRATGEYWPGAPWVQVGDFVRMPKWGGDRFKTKDGIPCGIITDEEIIAKVTDFAEIS